MWLSVRACLHTASGRCVFPFLQVPTDFSFLFLFFSVAFADCHLIQLLIFPVLRIHSTANCHPYLKMISVGESWIYFFELNQLLNWIEERNEVPFLFYLFWFFQAKRRKIISVVKNRQAWCWMHTDCVVKCIGYILQFLYPNVVLPLPVQRHKLFRKFGSFFVEFSAIALQFCSEGHAVRMKSYSMWSE